jgi:hypothetical protein
VIGPIASAAIAGHATDFRAPVVVVHQALREWRERGNIWGAATSARDRTAVEHDHVAAITRGKDGSEVSRQRGVDTRTEFVERSMALGFEGEYPIEIRCAVHHAARVCCRDEHQMQPVVSGEAEVRHEQIRRTLAQNNASLLKAGRCDDVCHGSKPALQDDRRRGVRFNEQNKRGHSSSGVKRVHYHMSCGNGGVSENIVQFFEIACRSAKNRAGARRKV